MHADDVEKAVWDEVVQVLSEPERLIAMAQDYLGVREEQIETDREQIATVNTKIAKHGRRWRISWRKLRWGRPDLKTYPVGYLPDRRSIGDVASPPKSIGGLATAGSGAIRQQTPTVGASSVAA